MDYATLPLRFTPPPFSLVGWTVTVGLHFRVLPAPTGLPGCSFTHYPAVVDIQAFPVWNFLTLVDDRQFV